MHETTRHAAPTATLGIVAIVAALAVALMAGAAASPVRATTEHCPDHASAPVKIEADASAEGSFELDGVLVSYAIDGSAVAFADEAGDPIGVEFCVKAATSTSGVMTGSGYEVGFTNNGGQVPDISYVAVYDVLAEPAVEVDIDALLLTSICLESDGTNTFRVRNNDDIGIAAGRLTYDVYGTAESGALGELLAGEELFFTTEASGSVTVRLFLDGELAETKASNSLPCEDDDGDAVLADLVVITQDAQAAILGGIGLTLSDGVLPGQVLITDATTGEATFAGLPAGSFALTVSSAPADCDVDGTLTVMVDADGTVSVSDGDAAAGIGIASWTEATSTLILELDCTASAVQGESETNEPGQSAGDAAGQGGIGAPVEAGTDQAVMGATGTSGAGGGTLPDTAASSPGSSAIPVLVAVGLLLLIGGQTLIAARRRR